MRLFSRASGEDAAEFRVSSDSSLLVYFGHEIALAAHERVRRLLYLLQHEPIAAVLNLHPAYCSILVKFDPLRATHEEIEASLRGYLRRAEKVKLPRSREIEIPVCYGGEFGPDFEDVCAQRGLTEQDAVGLHSGREYIVYFLGFVPGFAYLGELDARIATPRLDTPRKEVPAGSVGIAGSQTGVYPVTTPGGWRLIGRTPMHMFQSDGDGKSLLAIGDRVRFAPISRERFGELERSA